MMPAHFEITSGILRYSRDPEWAIGEPYDFVVTVDPDGDVATLKGHSGLVPTRAESEEIAACLKRAGFKRVRWERHTRRHRTVEHKIP
jgi:hypothetical protein